MKIRKILYPTDFSESASQALSHALFLAEAFEAELHMLHAIVLHDYDPQDPDQRFPDPPDIFTHLFKIAESEMAQLVKNDDARTFSIVEARERGFSAAQVILDYCGEHDIDVVVMGTQGRRGAARLLLGSVTAEVVRAATCPVLTLRKREESHSFEAIEKILVPIDFSSHSKKALENATELAVSYGAEIQLLHAVEEPAYPYFYGPIGALSVTKHLEELQSKSLEALNELAAEVCGSAVATSTHVTSGKPSTEVIRFVEEHGSDMIVQATHGLTGLERMLLGSTAEQIVRGAACPVFTVKSFGKSLL